MTKKTTQEKSTTPYTLIILLLLTSTFNAFAQKEELRLNENAVKMIQFDFTPQSDNKIEKMLEAPIDMEWKRFKEKVPFKRSFADTTTVKKIEGYVRAQPYTIWNRFDEDPINSVMPTIEKKWSVYWKLTPYLHAQEDYGKTITPSAGKTYDKVTAPSGSSVSIETDFNKLLFENLTARGRAIRHNRKYANSWKTYSTYVPTREDSARYPRFWKSNPQVLNRLPVYALSDDTTAANISGVKVMTASDASQQEKRVSSRQKKKEREKQKEIEKVTTIEQYIRQRAAEDSIRRHEFLRKDKERRNAFDAEKENRYYRNRRE